MELTLYIKTYIVVVMLSIVLFNAGIALEGSYKAWVLIRVATAVGIVAFCMALGLYWF